VATVGDGSCPLPLPSGDVILLAHGSGGRLTAQLIDELFVPRFGDPELARLGDAAVLDLPADAGGRSRLAFTTDAFVVSPPFFPGADIGSLAVFGTVNDLAMVGARPLALTLALVLEEGLAIAELTSIVDSMAAAARRAGTRIVAGDTKVVERGAADGLFVVTSGVGLVPEGRLIDPSRIEPGDAVVVSGPIGSHGVAVLSRRPGLAFETDVVSDSAPLTELVEAMVDSGEVHALRDATRGGVATVLNEMAAAAGVRVVVDERAFPMLDGVRSGCAVLGLDPLYVANEGVCVAIVAASDVDAVVSAARSAPCGSEACVVGVVESGEAGVHLRTGLGATRPLLVLTGDQLPRIC
jgi:hydrogenase expression/formation protein HypE